MKNEFHRRHHDDEIFDDISIKPSIRYKTSGLSGDEWRVGYVLHFGRKGTTLYERFYTRLRYATEHLSWVMSTMFEGGVEGFDDKAWMARIKSDETTCAQVGCSQPSTVFYRLKQTFAANGEGPLPDEGITYVTSFCGAHSTRGDCGREDADDNYVLLEGKVDDPSPASIKEALFGGFINLPEDV